MKVNQYEYKEVEAATNIFSSSNLIGKGSHGRVYKGVLQDGSVVAIKKQSLGLQKLRDNSKLDNEVRILSSLPRNQCLVNIFGTSYDSDNNQVLVMEHMPNGTLHHLLHSASTPPPWPKRAQFALQIARAVQFLHEAKPLIVHRDVKSANILFDSNWNAKLADFGLAVWVEGNDSPSRPPAGTIGYLDPCYTTPNKLSTKNDVFSFGVVLLEIVSCRRVIDVSRSPASIVEWAIPFIEEDRMSEVYDKRITQPPRYMEDTIGCMLNIAVRCVSSNEQNRPSIGEIVTEMEHCIVERVRFPLWMNLIQSLVLLKRQRRVKGKRRRATATTTAIICQSEEATGHVSRRKLLVCGKY